MAQNRLKYIRLPGRLPIPFFTQSLWQGEDHLLWVETIFFKQQYKRFYYQDIQAIIMRRSNDHRIWTILWSIVASIFGLITMSVNGSPAFPGGMALIFLVLVAINLGLGPTCTVRVQTAAQVQKITALRRVRTARKAMNQIRVLVEGAQGKLEDNL
jgi:hypothetical protein